jgi:hypothetical protein
MRMNPCGLIQKTVFGDSDHCSLLCLGHRARTSRTSSNFLNASFFWPGLIQVDIGLSVRLDPAERSNRGDWIRTSDLPVPNRTLYQAEPRPDIPHAYRFSLSSLGSSFPNRGKKP